MGTISVFTFYTLVGHSNHTKIYAAGKKNASHPPELLKNASKCSSINVTSVMLMLMQLIMNVTSSTC